MNTWIKTVKEQKYNDVYFYSAYIIGDYLRQYPN